MILICYCSRPLMRDTGVRQDCGELEQVSGSVKNLFRDPDRTALTQIKCYRGGALDEASSDSLTHIHGYPSHEYEPAFQTRVSLAHSRPLPTGRARVQVPHPRRVLSQLRLPSQSRAAAFAGTRTRSFEKEKTGTQTYLSARMPAPGLEDFLAGQRSVVQQAPARR